MTDHDQGDLSPEEEAAVRRLLGEAGGPLPTPPDVVTRLEATLADLVAEEEGASPATPPESPQRQSAQPTGGTVTPLAVRRRRWPKVLLAAAAVVVGGYAVGTAVTGSTAGDEDAASAGGATAESNTADSGDAEVSGGGSGSGADSLDRRNLLRDSELAAITGRRLAVSSDDFPADVRRALASVHPTASQNSADRPEEARAPAKARCLAPPATKRDRLLLVRYDGDPATLVVEPEDDGQVTAAVYTCRDALLIRTEQVEVP